MTSRTHSEEDQRTEASHGYTAFALHGKSLDIAEAIYWKLTSFLGIFLFPATVVC